MFQIVETFARSPAVGGFPIQPGSSPRLPAAIAWMATLPFLLGGCTSKVMITAEPYKPRYLISPLSQASDNLEDHRAAMNNARTDDADAPRRYAEQVREDTRKLLGVGIEVVWIQMPDYPAEAMRDGIEGIVEVQFLVNEEGRIASAEVTRSAGAVLDNECLRVVRQWRFKPVVIDGTVTAVWLRQKFPFVLTDTGS